MWNRTIRERKPLYINDYQAYPDKKVYPPGHIEITRFLSVPVVSRGQVHGMVMVANKPENYDDNDALQLTLFINAVWRAIERIQAEIHLNKEKERLHTILQSIGEGVIATDCKGRIDKMNQVAERLTGWSMETAQGHPLEEVFNSYDFLVVLD